MRLLKSKDLFAAMRVIKTAKIREELKAIMSKAGEKGADPADVGMEAFLMIIEALSEKKAERCMYELIAGPAEMKPEEVENLPLDELMTIIKTIAEENDLKGFFTTLSGLMNSK